MAAQCAKPWPVASFRSSPLHVGEVVLPPSCARRHDHRSLAPESLDVCSSSPATCSTSTRLKWWLGTFSRAYAGEVPPCTATRLCLCALTAALRLQAARAVRSHAGGSDLIWEIPLGLVHRGPMDQVYGAVHCHRSSRINDLRLRSRLVTGQTRG
jgi:hypothetical protein